MSGRYSVSFTPSARKVLGDIDRAVQLRIARKIDSPADDPRPTGAKTFVGDELRRFRVGDWRVFYEIRDKTVTVVIAKIGHRREVYR